MRSNSDRITNIAKATCNAAFDTPVVDDVEIDEYTAGEDDSETGNTIDSDDTIETVPSSKLLTFLATPRTAEELVIAGYCIPSEVLTYLYPLLKEGFIVYDDYHFSTVKGG